MNTKFSPVRIHSGRPLWLFCSLGAYAVIASVVAVSAQGIITFNNAAYFSGTEYSEQGMRLSVVVPTPGDHDRIGGLPAITRPSNVPSNDTPYMIFFRQFSPDNYLAFSLASGSSFGLTSVSLADPNSPSLSPLPITFVGFRGDGSLVSQTFTTPGNGANSFLTYQFNLDFASGLTRVEIPSMRWAMDNLVVVPEPSTLWLGLLGSGILVYARHRQIKKRSLR